MSLKRTYPLAALLVLTFIASWVLGSPSPIMIYGTGFPSPVQGNLDMNNYLIYDSTDQLDLGAACTDGYTMGTGAVCIGGDLQLDGNLYADDDLFLYGGTGVINTTAAASSWTMIDNNNTAMQIGAAGAQDLIIVDTSDSAPEVHIKGIAGQRALHVDVGNLTVDEQSTLTGNVTLGGITQFVSTVDGAVCVQAPTTDTAPNSLGVTAAHAYAQGTQTAGSAVYSAGMDEKYITVTDYNVSGTDVVSFYQLSTTAVAATTNYTEGTEWQCASAGSNNACASNLATAINGDGNLSQVMTAAAVGAVVYLQPVDCVTSHLGTAITGDFATSTNGTAGLTVLGHDSSHSPGMVVTPSTDDLDMYVDIDMQGNVSILYSSTSEVVLGSTCTDGHSQGTGDACTGGSFQVDSDLYLDGGVGAITMTGSGESSVVLADDDTTALVFGAAGDLDVLVVNTSDTAPGIRVDGDYGTASYNVDYVIPAGSANLGAVAPTWTVNDSCAGLTFDADNEYVNLTYEIPDCYADGDGDDINLRIYWCGEDTQDPAQGEVVKWDITSYRSIIWGTGDVDSGTAATGTVSYTEADNPGDEGDTYVSTITLDADDTDQPLNAGGTLSIRFDRDWGVGSNYPHDAIIQWWEIEIPQTSIKCNHY
jgi:hypothetical protein